MKSHILFTFLGLLLVAAAYASASPGTDVKEQFAAFVEHYGKTYADPYEYELRLAIFASNLAKIEEHNSNPKATTFQKVTQFTDMSQDEFKRRVLMSPPPLPENKPYIPRSFDGLQTWRGDGGLRSRKLRAFSATENIESAWALAGHKLTELSMQQIVDCDPLDFGCAGGWPYLALEGGMNSLASYPYIGAMFPCSFNASEVVAKVTDWTYVTVDKDEYEMASFVSNIAPVSVCLDAWGWQTYANGTYPAAGCDPTNISHCVLVVGYNLTATPPYWIIRNSWGSDWGMEGYLNLEFGKNACGVTFSVTSAII